MTSRAQHTDAQAMAAFRIVEVLHEVTDIGVVREGLQRFLIKHRRLVGRVPGARDHLEVMQALDGLAAAIQAQRDEESRRG